MRTTHILTAACLGLLFAAAAPRAASSADKDQKKEKLVKVVGLVQKVVAIAADDKTGKPREAVVTLRVHGKPLDILVRDELTLKKFDIKKISRGDEVRVKYRVIEEGEEKKNLAVLFKRTSGC